MAAGINFDQPSLDWSAPDLFQEFKRFEQHVSFSFLGPLATADKKHKAGWLVKRSIRPSRLRTASETIPTECLRNSRTMFDREKTNVWLVTNLTREGSKMVKPLTTS